MNNNNQISDITITNIKGFGEENNKLNIILNPKKINYIIAPNGYGKSSFATAFRSLKSNKIDIPTEFKFKKDDTKTSSLSFNIGDKKYYANNKENTISKNLNCFVVTCDIAPKVSSKKIGDYTANKGYIGIQEITATKNVYPKVEFEYRILKNRSNFGKNGKVLENIGEIIANKEFVFLFKENIDIFKKFDAKTRSTLINNIVDVLNSIEGTKEVIFTKADKKIFEEINKDDQYRLFKNNFSCYFIDQNEINIFSIFYQLRTLYINESRKIKSVVNWIDYSLFKDKLLEDLQLFNSSWKEIILKEVHGEGLVVKFPRADEISNGQRDVLTFIVRLRSIISKFSKTKSNLLIIDEIFDYLDDANILVAQYYLSKIINESVNSIYLVILSHLNPKYFRNYIFDEKKLQIQYLFDDKLKGNINMKTFIAFRESLDKNNDDHKKLYNVMSSFLFHYNPDEINLSIDIKRIAANNTTNLKTSWGNSITFREFILNELNKYLSGKEEFDPYSVCFAIRYRIEKEMYEMLDNDDDRRGFIDKHGLLNKLEFIELKKGVVPDAYGVVAAITNESEHLIYDKNNKNEFLEKSMIYKLNHLVIKNILKEMFAYNGYELVDSAIH
jgi:energy-coupling factor transporter ATP-binding protein EcfA2